MVVERSLREDFLANTYLVGEPGGEGFYVDAGGPVQPLVDAAREQGITPTAVLLTHFHWDHVEELPQLLEAHPGIDVLMDDEERKLLADAMPELAELVTGPLPRNGTVTVAGKEVRAIHTPGHTAGMTNLLVEGELFTADTLFKNSVGGVRAPGSTSYEDLRHSIMEVLMALPKETTIRPGHTDPTTVGDEWESNAFIRVWRGLDPEGSEPCKALGEDATLVLLGDDYDGGHKAWVRWPDGRDDIVPGSKVERG